MTESRIPQDASGLWPRLVAEHRWVRVQWIAVGVLALGLRAFALGSIPGLNGDEIVGRIAGGWVWLTPSGRPIDPFWLVLIRFFDFILPRSVWTLRLGALLSGSALVVLAPVLLRRVLSPIAAASASLWIAALPLLMAYSRVGWEMSQVGLATLVMLYCAMRRNAWGFVVASAAGALVHTSIGLLMPALLVFFFTPPIRWRSVAIVAVAVAAGGLAILRLFDLRALAGAMMDSQAGSLARYLLLPVKALQLLSGPTVYAGVVGFDRADFSVHTIVAGTYIGMIVVLGAIALRASRAWAAFAWLGALGLIWLATGWLAPAALDPGTERWGLFLAVPSCVALGVLYDAMWKRLQVKRCHALAIPFVGAWLLLVSFGVFYVGEFRRTGGMGDRNIYRTAPAEPKLAAAQWIARDHASSASGQRLRIVTEDWWFYWPIAYVIGDEQAELYCIRPNFSDAIPRDAQLHFGEVSRVLTPSTYLVGFPGGAMDRQVAKSFPSFRRIAIPASDGTPAVVVLTGFVR